MAPTRAGRATTSSRRRLEAPEGESAVQLGRGGAWRRRYRIARRRAGALALEALGPSVLRALARTWITRVEGAEHLATAEGERGHVMALWHGSMLLGLPHHARCGWSALVSPSDDGGLVVRLLRRFGYGVVRGSTSQGGARALRSLLEVLRRGGGVILTPDGPRGPRHSVNPGPAWMALRCGAAVVPCGFVCDRAWELSSWDRFCIPRPRARVVLVYGEPVVAQRSASEEELLRLSSLLRERMLAAEERGRALLAEQAGADSGGAK